jgi:tetratricopeptide (TPR) repeat protein
VEPPARQPGAEPGSRFCDACGQAQRATARFCAHCGADLPDAAQNTLGPRELARNLSARGEPLQARTVLEEALAVDGSDDSLRLLYAALLLQCGEWESGLEHLRQLAPTAAAVPVVQAYVGGALLGLNRVAEAKDVLDAAFADWPRDFYVLLKRGELYCRLGIYQTAVESLERANTIDCGDPVARDVVRRLLRFARDKNRSGFIRHLPTRATGLAFKARIPLGKRRADAAWET